MTFFVFFLVVKNQISWHLNVPLLKLKGACLVFLICIDQVLDEEVFILIASALIHHVPILTRDKFLRQVAEQLGISY